MLAAGQILGHYRVEQKLGEGAFGEVWRGVDVRLNRKVALKVMRKSVEEDPAAWGRLLEEARAASALDDVAICHTYDIGEEDGVGYIAMEYVAGPPLSEVLRAGPIPPATALNYAVEIAAAVGHAHGRGIIHRDIKASNVMITPEGHPKLLDFGLARRLEPSTIESLSQSRQSLADLGSEAGTLCYMAPELLRGKPAGARSDIWSLGALVYEMLSGKLPFQGQTPFELTMAIMVQQPPPLPAELPARLRSTVQKCLEKDPALRPASAGEAQAAFEESKVALAASTKRGGTHPFRYRVAAVAFISLFVLGGSAFAWWRQHRPKPPSTITVVHQPAASIQPPPSAANASSVAGKADPTAKPQAQSSQKRPAHAHTSGNPDTDVWVNLKTRVYHCPGTRWFKKTANGRLLKQRQAQAAGYHPASSKVCE